MAALAGCNRRDLRPDAWGNQRPRQRTIPGLKISAANSLLTVEHFIFAVILKRIKPYVET
jgi:hypothetical protein